MGALGGERASAPGAAVVITGANGFVGRACVAEARAQGKPVIAVVRSAPPADWEKDAGITPVRLDLTASDTAERLRAVLPTHGALIHAAAHLGDDPARLRQDTIAATRSVLAACQNTDLRIVLISSIAVYDTDLLSPGGTLTEDSPLIPLPQTPDDARDGYAGAKRIQETLLSHSDGSGWILRPGAIWGPGRSWPALLGFWAGKLHVTIGSDGELPLCHVDHIAKTALAAACTPPNGVTVVNVVDDDRPTRARFLRAHRRCFDCPSRAATVPFGLWLALVRLLRPVAHRLPGLFREPILRARMMPLRFPNTRLRGALGGEDSDTFEAMVARTAEASR